MKLPVHCAGHRKYKTNQMIVSSMAGVDLMCFLSCVCCHSWMVFAVQYRRSRRIWNELGDDDDDGMMITMAR